MLFKSFGIVFTSLFSIVITALYRDNLIYGYEYLWMLPLSFLFTYLLIYSSVLKHKDIKITTNIIVIISWLRCVLMPLIGTISSLYTSYAALASSESVGMAIMMIAYEQIFMGCFLFLYQNNSKKALKQLEINLSLSGNKGVYGIFLIFVLFIYLTVGRNLDLFQLFIISTEDSVRRGDLTNTSLIIIREILSSGLTFLFLLVIEKSRKSYYKTKKNIYITQALIAAVLLVGIIVGERRSSQIYLAFASTWLLIRIFPLKRKKIISTISFALFFVVLMMSIYKFFYAFNYGSYSAAIANSNIDLTWLAEMLDAYFFGVKVVSKNIGFANVMQSNIINMVYDFARSTFGLSFLVKGDMLTTSEIFNLTIYKGTQSTGHLFSSIGYGYVYFGSLFAPIVTCFNIYITMKLEKILRRCKSLEMNYIISYIFMRFAFGFFGNPAPLISLSSSYLVINGLIFYGATLFQQRSKAVRSYSSKENMEAIR